MTWKNFATRSTVIWSQVVWSLWRQNTCTGWTPHWTLNIQRKMNTVISPLDKALSVNATSKNNNIFLKFCTVTIAQRVQGNPFSSRIFIVLERLSFPILPTWMAYVCVRQFQGSDRDKVSLWIVPILSSFSILHPCPVVRGGVKIPFVDPSSGMRVQTPIIHRLSNPDSTTRAFVCWAGQRQCSVPLNGVLSRTKHKHRVEGSRVFIGTDTI